MHSRRPLVLVVHDDPAARIAQANSLTRAGYRCLVAGDVATALWFAMRVALDATRYEAGHPGPLDAGSRARSVDAGPGIVLLSPIPLPVVELPADMICLLTPASDSAIVEAVDRVSRLHAAQDETRCERVRVPAPVLRHPAFVPTDSVACS